MYHTKDLYNCSQWVMSTTLKINTICYCKQQKRYIQLLTFGIICIRKDMYRFNTLSCTLQLFTVGKESIYDCSHFVINTTVKICIAVHTWSRRFTIKRICTIGNVNNKKSCTVVNSLWERIKLFMLLWCT